MNCDENIKIIDKTHFFTFVNKKSPDVYSQGFLKFSKIRFGATLLKLF